ncbi:MAG: 16S rRNA processing protein RimM, partial [Patescibacteria group bacterium]
MKKSTHVKIGKTFKAHGLKGELKVHIDEEYVEDFLAAKALFLKTGVNLLPHFLKQVRGGAFFIAHFEEVNSRTEAEKLGGQEIYLRESDLIPEEKRTLEVEELSYAWAIGFTLVDEELGEIGVIKDIEEFPQQEMALVD